MDFVEYTRQCYYGTYRTNIATIVLPSTQVHCLGRILIFWLLPFTSKKNKGAVSHGYSRNHVKTYRQVLFSAIFPQSRLYCREVLSNRPRSFFQVFAKYLLIKALCRCKDLNLASSPAPKIFKDMSIVAYTKWPTHQRQMGIFAALKTPPKKRGYAFLNRLKTNP